MKLHLSTLIIIVLLAGGAIGLGVKYYNYCVECSTPKLVQGILLYPYKAQPACPACGEDSIYSHLGGIGVVFTPSPSRLVCTCGKCGNSWSIRTKDGIDTYEMGNK